MPSVFQQEVGLALNRAKCNTIVLRMLISVSMLAIFAGAALGQSARPTARRSGAAALQHTPGRAAASVQHPFYPPNMKTLPPGITRRVYRGNAKGHRAPGDQGVIRQTTLLTKSDPNAQFSVTPAQSFNEHPFWTADERTIYFDSNRNGPSDSTSTNNGPFNIYRMYPDGSGVVQILPDAANQQLDPAVSVDSSSVAFVAGGTIKPTGTQGFNLYLLNLNGASVANPLTNIGGSPITFDDVRHPSWSPGGGQIAFAGRVKGDTVYHIFYLAITSGAITQLTGGPSNDYAPSWSPDGNLIAFTTNADGFVPSVAPHIAGALETNDDIYVMPPNPLATSNFQSPVPSRVTNFAVGGARSSNRNPVWSSRRIDPQGIVPKETDGNGNAINQSEQYIAFSSNRIDTNNDGIANGIGGVGGLPNTTDIYWLYTRVAPTPGNPTVFTVATPETPASGASPGNQARKLRTSDPTAGLDPNEPTYNFDFGHTSNEDYPAWPQYQNSYRIVYQSDRGGLLEIWGSTIFDIDAPSLLKYDQASNEIVHVALDASPETSTREVGAGQVVRFRVRAEDYESGVESAFLQIKAPDSIGLESPADGLEHKVFFSNAAAVAGSVASPTLLLNAPFETDSQAVDAEVPFSTNFPTFRGTGVGSRSFPVPAGWPSANPLVPGLDDQAAFSGSDVDKTPNVRNWLSPLAPPGTAKRDGTDGKGGYWLQLFDDGPISKGGHEPEGEVAGDGIWTASWATPSTMPSDWILDVIIRDRAIDPFSPLAFSNWKIYDNVWGFTTRPFTALSNLLYVSDYDTGQKFLNSRFGSGSFGSFSGTPTESWMTEYDPALYPNTIVQGTGAPKPIGNYLTTLGANSYTDGLDDDGSGVPPTQRYDVWRIQCRGPLPVNVLNRYLPYAVQQPFDPISNTTPKPVVVAERAVIWHSPYSGDLFVGPGTILDATVQNQLKTFVASGGRLLVTGQDIAWGLTLGGSQPANDFLNNTLHAQYLLDDIFTAPSSPVPPDRNEIKMTAADPKGLGRGGLPIGWETWFLPILHNYPGGPPPLDFPPAAGSIYLFSTNTAQAREFGANNQAAPDVVSFIDDGATSTFKPYPGTTAYFDDVDARYNLPGIPGQNGTGPPAIMWYTDNTANSKIVFSPFGWEAINPETATVGTATIFLNRRTELLHNALDYMRTGRIFGFIRVINASGGPSTPLGGARVRAVDTNGQIYTATSLNDGSYTLLGLYPSGIYGVDAIKAGFVTQHAISTAFHGAYQSETDFYLTQAQPGAVSGLGDIITDASTGQPVAGAIVTALDTTNPNDPNAPSYSSPPSDSTGHYMISNLPASTYTLFVSNLGKGVLANYVSSIPVNYTGVVVTASSVVDNKPFALKSKPGTITGFVHIANPDGSDSGKPLPGATVTATSGTVTFTTAPAVSGPDGSFTLPNVDPGTYGLVASAPGYAPTTPSVSVVVTTNQLTAGVILLEKQIPPGSISGLVATSGGIPVSGATVTETDPAGGTQTVTTGQVLTKTLPNGNAYTYNYSFSVVPAGTTVQVTATKAGYTPKPNPDTQSVTVVQGTESTGINFTLDPLFVFDNDLALVSMPYLFTTDGTATGPLLDPVTLLGVPGSDVSSRAFAFVTWDATSQRYIYFPTPPADGFHLGRGYFLQDTNTGTTLALTNATGIPAAKDVTGAYAAFPIALQQGWNMIGTPFTTPVDFSKLQVKEADGTLVNVPAAQTGTNPDLGAALWTYAHGSYQVVYTLDPFRGYWLLANKPVTLIVTASAQQGRSLSTMDRALEYTNSTAGDWKLKLVASASGVITSQAMLGAHRAAADTYDRFKMMAPPTLHDTDVTITFDHNDWANKSGRYAVDVRSASNASWDFVVRSNQVNQPLTLTWPNLAQIGRRDVTLTDLDSQVSFNLRNRSAYTIPNGSGPLARHFRMTVQRATRQKLQIVNVVTRQAGSRASGASSTASVDYTLTSDAQVEVSVLRGGRRVRRLGSGTRAAGASTEVWDLKDDRGVTLPASVYLVEVRAMDRDGRMVRRQTPLVITR